MRHCHPILLAIAATSLFACEKEPTELRLITPKLPVGQEIARDFADLLGEKSSVNVTLVPAPEGDETVLEALASGDGDLAIITDIMPFRPDVATVMPLYPTVLHVVYRKGRSAGNAEELLTGANVYAGPPGSSARFMLDQVSRRDGLPEGSFTYVDSADLEPDVIVVFAPISPDRLRDFSDYQMYSMGKPEDVGTGAAIDAITLLQPRFEAFVIPTGTYGDLTPEPILTISVNQLLVARRDLDRTTAYDLVGDLVSLRPALVALRPGLFGDVSGDFDPTTSTYVVHPGALDYTQRDAPSVYERYSGIAEVTVTILIGIISAGFAGLRIYHMRRKNLIDTFYSAVNVIKKSIDESITAKQREEKAGEIRTLQLEAFDLLVDEKLAADESFRIFITLSNDVLRQLDTT